MSPSVYESRLLLSSASQDLRMFVKPEVRKVKRALFGPVDHKATQKFIAEELKKIIITKSEEWNFDFRTQSTLKPDGLYEWRPATPRREMRTKSTPVKRKVEETDEEDIADQYCELPETDFARPKPDRCSSHSQPDRKQRRITDYMKSTKRPLAASEVSKKPPSQDWNADIPTKIPRLDIVS